MDVLLVYVFLHTDPKVLFVKGLCYVCYLSLSFPPPRNEKVSLEERVFFIRSKVFETFAVLDFKEGPQVLAFSQNFEGF